MNNTQKELLIRRIVNWTRWTLSGGSPRSRCASAEGRYVAPRLAEGEEEEKSAIISQQPVDPLDAELLDRCLHAIRHPLERSCLVAWHLGKRKRWGWQRMERTEIARVLNVRPALITMIYDNALVSLRYQLELAVAPRAAPPARLAYA